eukprot:scaffold8119_cov444-Prasinococcus_capsulatus_cf.AAC.4
MCAGLDAREGKGREGGVRSLCSIEPWALVGGCPWQLRHCTRGLLWMLAYALRHGRLGALPSLKRLMGLALGPPAPAVSSHIDLL